MNLHQHKIAKELGVLEKQVNATVELLDEGATIPFIARYRKEVTGTLDEVQVSAIRDRITQLRDLDKRREAILKSLEELGKLSPELTAKINEAETMSALEDIYLPYKPKRKTKASVAKEKGLEPLALLIFEQNAIDLDAAAAKFIDTEKGVNYMEEALQGARDIIAESISENAEARAHLRDLFLNKVSEIEELENKVSKLKEEIREIENKFKEDNLRVFFNSSNNRYYGNEKKSFGMSLLDGKGNEYGLYKEIEKEIILSGINSEFDIKKFIEELVEKFK